MLGYLDARRGLCYSRSGSAHGMPQSLPFAFPGTADEAVALCAAVARWCACSDAARCGPHGMLLDVRVVRHLIFARRMARHWRVREFNLDA
jgi:hypothetical protein